MRFGVIAGLPANLSPGNSGGSMSEWIGRSRQPQPFTHIFVILWR